MLQDNDKNVPICEDCEVHSEILRAVGSELPDDEHLYNLAEFFSVIGDSTRIKILYVLFEAEMCVCDIAEALNMTISAISHQLRILKQAHLVKYRRDGKSVWYSLDDDHVRMVINMGNEHINEIFGGRKA